MKTVCILVQSHYDIDIRVRRKAEALVAAGYDVDVIALRKSGSKEREYTLNGVKIYTIAVGKSRGSLLTYFSEYSTFFIAASWKVFRLMGKRRYRIVDANNLPDFLVFAGLWAKLRGAKVVFDMHEITPEFYISKYGISEKSLTIKFLKVVERISMGFSDHVITINRAIQQLLLTRGLVAARSTIVMNAVDEALFFQAREGSRPAGIPAEKPPFVMMYHGTLTKIYGLDVALEAFGLAKEKMPGAEFWILGGGPEKKALSEQAARLGLESQVKFIGTVLPDEIPHYLAYCDIGVLATRCDVFLDLSYSNKLSEYIITGKAVICSRLRAIGDYFSPQALSYFEPHNATDLAAQMVRLFENPVLREQFAEQAKEEYKPIRWEIMKERYLELTAKLAGKGSNPSHPTVPEAVSHSS